PAVGLTLRCPAAAAAGEPQHRNSPRRLRPSNPSLPGPARQRTKAAVSPALVPQRAGVRLANPTISSAAAATAPVAAAAAAAPVAALATARRPQEGKTRPASAAPAGLRKAAIKEAAAATPPRPSAQTGTEPVAPAAAPAAVIASVQKQYNSKLHAPVKCEAAGAAARLHHVTLTVAAVTSPQGTAIKAAAPVSELVAQPHGPPPPLVVQATTSRSGGKPAAAAADSRGVDPHVRVPTVAEATAKRQGLKWGAAPAATAVMPLTLPTSGPAGWQQEATVAVAVAGPGAGAEAGEGERAGVPPSTGENVARVPSAKATQMQHVPGAPAAKQTAAATRPAAAKQTAAATRPPPVTPAALKPPVRDAAKPCSPPAATKRAAARPGPVAAAAAGGGGGGAAKGATRAPVTAATKADCVAGQPPPKCSLAPKPNSAPVCVPTRRLSKSYAAMAQASAERMPDRAVAAAAGRSVKAATAKAGAALPPALQLPRTPWKVSSKAAPKPQATKRRAPGMKAPVAAAAAAANKAPAAKPLKAPPPAAAAAGIRRPATIKQVSAAGPATVEVVLTASPMPVKCDVASLQGGRPAGKAAAAAGRQLKANGRTKDVIPPLPQPQPQLQRKSSRAVLVDAAAAAVAASTAPVPAVPTSAPKPNRVTGQTPPSEAMPTAAAPPENNTVRIEPVGDSVRRSKAEVTAAAAIAAAAAAAAAAAMMTRRSTTVRPKLYAELLEVARRGQAAKPAPKPAGPKAAVGHTAVRQGLGPRSASKAGLGSGCGFEAPQDPDLGSRRAENPATAIAATPRLASMRTAVQAASPGATGDPLVTARWDGTAVAPPPPAVTLASAAAVTMLHPPRSPAAAVRSALPASGSQFTTAVGSRGAFTRQGYGPGLVSESPHARILDSRHGAVAALVPLPAYLTQMAPADANPANVGALRPASLIAGHLGTAAVAPTRMPTATQVVAATAVQAARQRTAAAAMPPLSPPPLYDSTRSCDTARERTIVTAATGTASGNGEVATVMNATAVAATRRRSGKAGPDKRASRRPMGLGATPISAAAVGVSPSPPGRVDLSSEVAALRTAVSKPVHGSSAPINAPVAVGVGRSLGPTAVEDKASARSSCGETNGFNYGAAALPNARVLARGYGVRGSRWK
ncbi:hypothetical protein VaNZ11_011083, partial [Volvox africanus]